MSEFKLASAIVKLSRSKTWDEAKLEWQLVSVYEDEDLSTCLCGHFPIKEICTISNKYTKRNVDVGNCCVKKFLGLRSDLIFQALKRVRKDFDKSLNAEAIDHAYKHDWINDWEKDFYFDTMRKRSLSERQAHFRRQINQKVLNHFLKKKT